jgi:ubiquinone/menaquinone biosynthesis C-methylase UbiE
MSHWTAQHANDYDERWGELNFHRKIPNMIGVSPGAKVTELGCGGGFLAVCLAHSEPGVSVLALDPSPVMIERAGERKQKADLSDQQLFLLCAGAEQWQPEPCSQDVVVAAFSVHHWRHPEQVMATIANALKPGGKFWLCEDLNTPSFGDLDVHQELKALSGLIDLLEKTGFKNIQHQRQTDEEGDFLMVEGIWE